MNLNKNDLKKLNQLFQDIGIDFTEKELLEEGIILLNLVKILLSLDVKNDGDK